MKLAEALGAHQYLFVYQLGSRSVLLRSLCRCRYAIHQEIQVDFDVRSLRPSYVSHNVKIWFRSRTDHLYKISGMGLQFMAANGNKGDAVLVLSQIFVGLGVSRWISRPCP